MKPDGHCLMQPRARLSIIILIGLFADIFLMLVTASYYKSVLDKAGVSESEETKTYSAHFVLIAENPDSGFWQDVFASVSAVSATGDAYVELLGASHSMTENMEMCIAAGVDGIFLEYTGGEDLFKKIDEAAEAGIPVVTLRYDAPTSARASYVGMNSYSLSEDYVGMLRKLLPAGGKISVLLHGRNESSGQGQIFDQIRSLLVSDENMQIERVDVDSEEAFSVEAAIWTLFRDTYSAPDAIVCMDERDSETVYQALIDYNRVGLTQIIGYYQSDSNLLAGKTGGMSAVLSVDTAQMGQLAAKAMLESVNDGMTNSYYGVDQEFITY